jgi:hypothetical protein
MAAGEDGGRLSVAQLVNELVGLDATSYAARFPMPLLLQLNEGQSSEPLWKTTARAGVQARKLVAESFPLYAFRVEKRPGANAFSHMITIGRAANNDVVLPYEAISKFHASLVTGPNGWSLTDARSSNGSWLEGQALIPLRPYTLRSGITLDLAHAVLLMFVEASEAFDLLTKRRDSAPAPDAGRDR